MKTTTIQQQVNTQIIVEDAMATYGNELLYIAFSYVKDVRTAEDITQDVFLTLFNQFDTFRGDSSLKTWLIRITINQCKDYIKSWNATKVILSSKLTKLVKGKAETLETTIMDKETNTDLINAVLSLPIKYREVIFLYYFEDLTIHEMADCLNQNENTLKTQLTRAKELLRKLYEQGGESSGR